MGTSLQSDFCSWLAFQAHRTTLAVLLPSPCPSECQHQGFALLISLSLSPVPFLQFLHPPALLHSHVCILAIEALATILQVPIPETLLSLTSATGCGSLPTHRHPHFPVQLLRTLQFSACVRGFQFTEGFPCHLQTFTFRL